MSTNFKTKNMRISEKREIAIKEINEHTIVFQKGISVFNNLKLDLKKEHKLHIERIDDYISAIERTIDDVIEKTSKKYKLDSSVLKKIINCKK